MTKFAIEPPAAQIVGEALDAARALEHFRAIVESSDDAIISKTLEGIVTSWNPGAQAIFGYTAAEMIGQPMLILFPPERSNEEAFILEKIIEGEKVEHFETTRVRKDGHIIQVDVTISPVRDAVGRVIGASKIARDVTVQRAAEQRLSVFTNTSEGILILDRAGRIVEVNQAFSKITGYGKDEVLGRFTSMFRSSRQGPEVFDAMRRALRRTGDWRGELWSRRSDGEAFSALVTVSAVRSASGRVRNFVALFSDVTVLRLQQEQLEHTAHFDPLTDLPNRLLLSDRLHQAMAMCLRHNQSLAVLYLDLDGFKAINDRHGHEVGDDMLIAVSGRMKTALRDVDTLARMGGDEFVAILADIERAQDCIALVSRVLAACAEPVRINGLELKVTASIGVTMYPRDNAEADQLMRHADQAMYEAKQAGKNRYHMFDAVHDAEIKVRSQQQERIGRGLEQQEFVLHYQPKVNMRTGALVGVEALVRWEHPERGLLAPAAFLPAIEKHPLNEAMGAWVLEAALQQMSAWKAQGLNLNVSVNVGARQLQQENFAGRLAELLAHYPEVDASCLELEVLETSALEDLACTSAIMHDCHRLGVRFALDDFGTGYSSLTYLRRLPVETLKIDQSFVRDMLVDDNDLSIVRGVIGLAAAFHRDVIAEGVETVAHGQRLIALGCELAQGYEIARPMAGGLIASWFEGWTPPAQWLATPVAGPPGAMG
jgi:diguanylate cyclase (GGDEF)-like protein/PAS domain S-box-containing protein